MFSLGDPGQSFLCSAAAAHGHFCPAPHGTDASRTERQLSGVAREDKATVYGVWGLFIVAVTNASGIEADGLIFSL